MIWWFPLFLQSNYRMNYMKYIVLILMCFCFISPSKAQTYDELINKAMDAVEQDSLLIAENYFKEALRLEPANMRNSLFVRSICISVPPYDQCDCEYYSIPVNCFR